LGGQARRLFSADTEKQQSLTAKFNLTWTHYQILMRIDDEDVLTAKDAKDAKNSKQRPQKQFRGLRVSKIYFKVEQGEKAKTLTSKFLLIF
jgi:hypothetical protein